VQLALFGARNSQDARRIVEYPLTHHDVEDPLGQLASLDAGRGSIGCKDIRYSCSMEVMSRNRARNVPARMEMGNIETTRRLR